MPPQPSVLAARWTWDGAGKMVQLSAAGVSAPVDPRGVASGGGTDLTDPRLAACGTGAVASEVAVVGCGLGGLNRRRGCVDLVRSDGSAVFSQSDEGHRGIASAIRRP